ncbi:hypothetical protein K7X08_002860 [Anisodus acutangulus]|uniref:Uncharacterized protein n=1 Tax=Anisodus acutangulus TaxID=402998 RepID=A0A9Q1RI55_9SOLA|nr:hypothetical protein K7X08_002860 [Anisodus acutangulus]
MVITGNLRPTDATTALRMLFRRVLKAIHLKRYRGLSSYSGGACVLSLAKSLLSHSTTCSWIPPREKCTLSRALLLLFSEPVIRWFTNPVTLVCVTWQLQSVLRKIVHVEYSPLKIESLCPIVPCFRIRTNF